jgi:hypothetical protein
MRSSATSRVSDIGKSSQITAHQAIANDVMNTMSRGNSHALAAPPAMMRAMPSSAAAAPERCASSCARDRGGSESDRREGEYFAQRTRDADDDWRVEPEQYSGEVRDDDDSDVRHAVRGLPLHAAFARPDAYRKCQNKRPDGVSVVISMHYARWPKKPCLLLPACRAITGWLRSARRQSGVDRRRHR